MTVQASLGAEAPPRRITRLLRDRRVGPFVASNMFAFMGMWVHIVGAALLVFAVTGSTTAVALVTIAQFVPQMSLTVRFGVLADRGHRVRLLIGGRACAAVGSLLLAGWLFLVGDGPGLVPAVMVASVLNGIGHAMSGPALQSVLPSLVRRSELSSAVTLYSFPLTVGRAVGPGTGALLVTSCPLGLSFAVAGLLQMTFVIAVWLIRVSDRPSGARTDASLRVAVRHILRDPRLIAGLLGVAACSIGNDPVVTLTPALVDSLGGRPVEVGVVTAGAGFGAIAAFALLGVLRRRLGLAGTARLGLLLTAAGLAGAVLLPTILLATVAFVVVGAGASFSITALTALIQHVAPEPLRGRIMAIWTVAMFGSRPVGAFVSGAVADHVSLPAAFGLVIVVVLLGTWACRARRIGTEL